MKFVGPWTVYMCTVHCRKSTFAVTVHWTVTAILQNAWKLNSNHNTPKRVKTNQKKKKGTKRSLETQTWNPNTHLCDTFCTYACALNLIQYIKAEAFNQFFMNSTSVHCLRVHKFHFLSIFSLKMGPTSLFTHLKIILLQCFQFSVFSFSKISSIQTHPI